MRRLSERLRTSIAEKIANAISASTETTTKTISHGDVMTSSIQLCSNVPCGARSSAGVVYVAVAGARPGDLDAHDRPCARAGAASDSVTSYSLESCWPISVKIGCERGRLGGLDVLPPVRFAQALQRLRRRTVGDLSPTEMTRTFASLRACERLGAGVALVPTSVAVGEEDERRPLEALRPSPCSTALMSAS